MMVIRPARLSDLNEIEKCALTAGTGMTHLPRHRDSLEEMVLNSLSSFSDSNEKPQNPHFLFVLEDLEKNTIDGTSGIYSKTGVPIPFYVYRIETMRPLSSRLPGPKEPRMLRLVPYINGPSEIGALFLLPEYRHSGLGKLLSLSRFLFMASHQHLFSKFTIANMRGVIENEVSSFWNGLGRHFLDVELQEVIEIRTKNEHLISDIFPPYPIPVTLLPHHVKEVIGQVHAHTKSALNMLLHQGFQFISEIDPFDGGPIISAEIKNIKTVKDSKIGIIKEISSQPTESKRHIISTMQLNFRACYGQLSEFDTDSVIITEDVANALEVHQGDTVRYISL